MVNSNQTRGQIIQAYTNASSYFTFGDWLDWSGLSLLLQPNTTYAYTFANDNTGYAQLNTSMASVTNDSVGLACLISPGNGAISLDTGGNSGVFEIGLTPVGVAATVPQATPIVNSPGGTQTAGAQITLDENASGASPLRDQWQTDGGSGGSLTNISANNSSNLLLNTAGWQPGVYRYDVIVSNTYGTSTSGIIPLTIIYANSTGALADLGANPPTPRPYDIAQLLSTSGEPAGLNYYFDNGTPPGETFTTGSNPLGYNLTNVDILLAGGSGGPLPPGGQGYFLRIYSVNINTTNATLFATYESQTNFVLTTGVNDTDWIGFGGISVPLQPNTTYAYTFGRDHSQSYDIGWDEEASDSGNPYAGGQAVLIGPTGGPITEDSAGGVYDATFDLGLSLGTVTLNAKKVNGGLQLQWSAGILLESTNLLGSWTTNTGAASPYMVSPTAPATFYKIQVQ